MSNDQVDKERLNFRFQRIADASAAMKAKIISPQIAADCIMDDLNDCIKLIGGKPLIEVIEAANAGAK